MRQPYELSIAVRYLRTRSAHSFISFISAVSMIGIALAVAVLIVVLSVMNGFESELQQRILGMVSDAQIIGYPGRFTDWQEARERVLDRDDVEQLHLGRQLGHVIDVARHDFEAERLLEPRHDDADVVGEQEPQARTEQRADEPDDRPLHDEDAKNAARC